MLTRFNVNMVFKDWTKDGQMKNSWKFYKFFSILYDDEALMQGIIKRENVQRLIFFASLLHFDIKTFNWLGLNGTLNEKRLLYIIGSLFRLGCFADDVNVEMLAKFIEKRWKFADQLEYAEVRNTIFHESNLDPVDDRVALYWQVAKYIQSYDMKYGMAYEKQPQPAETGF